MRRKKRIAAAASGSKETDSLPGEVQAGLLAEIAASETGDLEEEAFHFVFFHLDGQYHAWTSAGVYSYQKGRLLVPYTGALAESQIRETLRRKGGGHPDGVRWLDVNALHQTGVSKAKALYNSVNWHSPGAAEKACRLHPYLKEDWFERFLAWSGEMQQFFFALLDEQPHINKPAVRSAKKKPEQQMTPRG